MTVATFPHPRQPGRTVTIDLSTIDDFEQRHHLAQLGQRWEQAGRWVRTDPETQAAIAVARLRSDWHTTLHGMHRPRRLDLIERELQRALDRYRASVTRVNRLAAQRHREEIAA